MRVLAIETTERIGTVALAEGGCLVAQVSLDAARRSAQSLAPALVQILADACWKPEDVELVAVTVGPGSFTGLRVGVTTAKAFAYSVGADILGINTLDAIAAATDDNVRRVAVAVDAQRGQVVAAQFSRGDDGWFRREGPTRLLDIEAWLAALPDATTVSGPILKKLGAHVPERLQVASSACWRPTAAMVARLAVRDYAAGRRDDLWTLLPVYSRQSAAEEKQDARL